jgi:PTS system N-acetylglucosamine-specific IIC component
LLYALHAVLTGTAMVIMHALDVHLGFSFSAGLFDFVLNFNRATRPWLLLPVGAAYFAIYYAAFTFFIRFFNLKTPGREADDAAIADRAPPASEHERAQAFIKALGGASNLVSVDACTTRLRLVVAQQAAVNAEALKQLGARGLIRPTENAVQVVLGPIADQVADEIRAGLRAAPLEAPGDLDAATVTRLLNALGGRQNLRAVEAAGGRILAKTVDDMAVDEAALRAIAARGIARPARGSVHVLLGPAADAASQALRKLIL